MLKEREQLIERLWADQTKGRDWITQITDTACYEEPAATAEKFGRFDGKLGKQFLCLAVLAMNDEQFEQLKKDFMELHQEIGDWDTVETLQYATLLHVIATCKFNAFDDGDWHSYSGTPCQYEEPMISHDLENFTVIMYVDECGVSGSLVHKIAFFDEMGSERTFNISNDGRLIERTNLQP